MKNTPEVTTALAMLAARLSNDKTFAGLPCGLKQLFFQVAGSSIFRFCGLSTDQEKKFSERFTETIIVPWCYEENQNDAR